MPSTLPLNFPEQIRKELAQEPRILDWAAIRLEQSVPGEELLHRWIGRGDHADMAWIPAGLEARCHPQQLLTGARSMVLFLWKYPQPLRPALEKGPLIAAFAQGKDYHQEAGTWVAHLISQLGAAHPNARFRLFVDSMPVQERAWAAHAGLGWIGKNSLLLHPKYGSGFCIAGFLCDQDIQHAGPMPKSREYCGSCTRCVEACPTQAIQTDRTVNARRCISYLSIEKRGDFAEEEAGLLGNWLFGCDICQTVCPWNRKQLAEESQAYWPTDLEEWNRLLLPGNGLRKRLKGTPLDRVGRKGLQRNIRTQ